MKSEKKDESKRKRKGMVNPGMCEMEHPLKDRSLFVDDSQYEVARGYTEQKLKRNAEGR